MSADSSPEKERPNIVSSRPITYQIGDSCFAVQEHVEDGVASTALKLFQGAREPHTFIHADGALMAISVEPLPDHGGVYIGILTYLGDTQYLATLAIEDHDGLTHQRVELEFDAHANDDLALRYDHQRNVLFVTSHHSDGTLARVDNIIKGKAA